MSPEEVKIDADWREALKNEFTQPYFDSISKIIRQEKEDGKVIFPPGKLIFNAYNHTKPTQVKVVIIGQDPYHNTGEAMGLSFSVPKGMPVPPSLKNIYKELASDTGFIIPNHGDLSEWSSQGVFLLNAILTVEKNNPGSHKNIGWQTFTDRTIAYLSESRDNIVFLLWGNFAKNKKGLIDSSRHLILESAHPSPLAGNAFQGSKHFSKANAFLQSKNIEPVNWQIT